MSDLPTDEPFVQCDTCADYLDARFSVLKPEINAEAHKRGLTDPRPLFVTYMRGVHGRHLAGLSLAVTP